MPKAGAFAMIPATVSDTPKCRMISGMTRGRANNPKVTLAWALTPSASIHQRLIRRNV